MTQPTAFNQVIGNVAAIDRIKSEIVKRNGLGGSIFLLQGDTGTGKTMLANMIAGIDKDADVYDESRIDCNDDDNVAYFFDTIKSLALTPSLTGTLSIFVFNECDRLSVENVSRFKTVVDAIRKVQNAGKVPPVCVIFTTAKTKATVNPAFQKHWDEFCDRCAYCRVGVTMDELNEYFSRVTDGAVTNMSFKIRSTSVRKAWEYCDANNLPVIDIMPEPEPFVLPESGERKIEFVQANRPAVRTGAPKPQQNLIGIIRDVVASIGEPVSYAEVRRVLDESGTYVFKKGVEGWRRTNQIVYLTEILSIGKGGERRENSPPEGLGNTDKPLIIDNALRYPFWCPENFSCLNKSNSRLFESVRGIAVFCNCCFGSLQAFHSVRFFACGGYGSFCSC